MISGDKVTIKVSGAATAFNNEPTTGDGGRKTYQITDASKQVWDRTAAISVQVSTDGGATWNDAVAGTYTIDRLFGKIAFTGQQVAGTSVQVSGSYLPMTATAEAHSWTDSGASNAMDVTPLGSTWKKFIQGQNEASGDIADFDVLDPYYTDALTAGAPVVLEYNDGAETYRAWALLNKDEIKATVANPEDKSVSWTGTTDADGRVMSVG